MLKQFIGVLCAGVCLVAVPAAIAQSTTTAPPAPQSTTAAAPAAQPTPTPGPGMPTMPPVTQADIDRCAGHVPDGGVPVFLRPETPQQRKERIGTEDPGCEPDLTKPYYRYGKEYTIGKYDKFWAVYNPQAGHDDNAIRPFGFANSYRELFQQNEKWVWVWEAKVTPQAPAEEDLKKSTDSERKYSDKDIDYLQYIRSEMTELAPKQSGKTIRFEEASEGLPTSGSWRNSLAVADMNGDGFPDIIAPPERGAAGGVPMIYLGDGKGHWHDWEAARWPHRLDYGSVAAADFNKDGHMDLVFAVHLTGLFVFMGDGKGTFSEVTEGLPRDFPTRRVIVADVDHDGYPDIVTISEGPTAIANAAKTLGKIRVYFNRGKGKRWEGVDVIDPRTRVGGDYLAMGNLNGDKVPDFIAGSIYMGSPDIIYMSKGPKTWSLLDSKNGTIVPFLSYYFASTIGRFTSKKTDDALVSYIRFWPPDVNPKLVETPPATGLTGIDFLSFGADGSVKRTPVLRRPTRFGVNGMAAADMDGDGKLDAVFSTAISGDEREIGILLGDGKGNFSLARTEGLKAPARSTYDVQLADVNGDGRPDIIMMYEADHATALAPRDGSIRVYLNRGPVVAAPSK